jgi:hypothetical protein
MASSSRFNCTLLALALSSIGAFAPACSDGDSNDGGVAGTDAADAEDAAQADADAGGSDTRDARPGDVDPPDLGAPDLGSCGCSYGFQQQCAEDETCGRGFSGEPMCTRAEPFGGTAFGGCSMTATATGTMGAACTAQCVSALEGSPCGAVVDRLLVGDAISAWWLAVISASRTAPGPGPNAMRAEDVSLAITSGTQFPECGEYIKWTVLAAISLCRGEGAVIPPPPPAFPAMLEWRFRHTESTDDCQITAESRCLNALEYGVEAGEIAADAVNEIPQACPVLPYGSPCQGADAQRCLRARIATMIRALNTPFSD